jgi:hypothetical protein
MKRFQIFICLTLLLLPAAVFAFGGMPGGEPSLQTTGANSVLAPPPAPMPQPTEPHKGKVVQVVNSGGYTYVLLKKKNNEKIWIAVPDSKIEVGTEATFNPGMIMYNFESKTLKKTFDQIVFTDMPKQPEKAAKDKKLTGKSPGSGAVTTASPNMKVKVKKATGAGAYTIAELYKNKAKLNKKQVTVRGKVVKMSSNIMNKTWIHLRDGTGGHATGDFNLVVTSKTSTPAEGEVVLIKGTLFTNKDFGGGYKYDLIVEDAEITVE